MKPSFIWLLCRKRLPENLVTTLRVMRLTRGISETATIHLLICALLCAPILAQTPTKPREDQDVVRVYSELVQTDVMVFDKQGHFIDGLKKENFELRIDGQPKPIDFFERITAGSSNEESQLAAARGSANLSSEPGAPAAVPLDWGRPIFFFLDDLHLDLASLNAAKKMIGDFIDNQMGQNDQVAIASASGQIGFLQQLTDNKAVLRAALNRLNVRGYDVRDHDDPVMTEYQALRIENFDQELANYFIAQTVSLKRLDWSEAEAQVRRRAGMMLRQADAISVATLSSLDILIRSANKLPGRKLVFFISGGFFLNPRENAMDRLGRVTAAAAKNGVVVYTMDARGLITDLTDVTTKQPFDRTGMLARANSGELLASQDALNALARDTGGKPVFDTNALDVALARVLKDTSVYYLLAWKPEGESQHASKFHKIEVKVIGRPGLVVQVRRGFYDVLPEQLDSKTTKPKANETPEKTREEGLRHKLATPYPVRDIPVSLDLNYLNTTDRGWMLNAMMEVPAAFLTFQNVDGKSIATTNVVGVFYNDKGQLGGSFNQHITVPARIDGDTNSGGVRYSYPIFLPPGLYHVRVAAQDVKSGRVGSAHSWVEVPMLPPNQLGLSSVLIGARPPASTDSSSESSQTLASSVELSVSHRFVRESTLRFVVFIYNAAHAAAPGSKADLALTVQMIRDGQPVVTTPLKKISTDGVTEFLRMFYAGEFSLAGLPSGRYQMQVTVIDRISKQSASQRKRFEIE